MGLLRTGISHSGADLTYRMTDLPGGHCGVFLLAWTRAFLRAQTPCGWCFRFVYRVEPRSAPTLLTSIVCSTRFSQPLQMVEPDRHRGQGLQDGLTFTDLTLERVTRGTETGDPLCVGRGGSLQNVSTPKRARTSGGLHDLPLRGTCTVEST